MGLFSSLTGDGLLGGALGFLGQRSANRANSAQAARSMAFQKETAQNAHQWEVADLKKAGLNPLLSGTGGKGASASGGAQATIENEANSAMTSKLLQAQANAQNAQSLNTQEQTKLIKYGLPAQTLGTGSIESAINALTPKPNSAKKSIKAYKKPTQSLKDYEKTTPEQEKRIRALLKKQNKY